MTDPPFILIVEDHMKIRTELLLHLRDEGYAAHAVTSAEEAEVFLRESGLPPQVLLADVRLSGMTGVELVRRLHAANSLPPTIIISGEASISETVEALRLGVYDLVEKPFTRERLLQSVRNCVERAALEREVAELRSRVRERHPIIGRSPQVAALRERIERVAATSARVLIRGESGTGKELVAAALHQQSARRDAPFVKINCAAIPAPLIEAELFGHARGAFTDARQPRAGLFEEAHGGTLFLDEVGDMEPSLQSRLLRVLEDGRVRRVGETQDRPVDVRVVAATNRPLEKDVAQGRFREDLFFRLATVPIEVPPLRDRAGDVRLLFGYFVDRFCDEHQRPKLSIDRDVYAVLEQYRWPGNVRELRNICEQLAIFAQSPITVSQLPFAAPEPEDDAGSRALVTLNETGAFVTLREFREQCEALYIAAVLRHASWNYTDAARVLDIQRTYLHQKAAALHIERPGKPSRET